MIVNYLCLFALSYVFRLDKTRPFLRFPLVFFTFDAVQFVVVVFLGAAAAAKRVATAVLFNVFFFMRLGPPVPARPCVCDRDVP